VLALYGKSWAEMQGRTDRQICDGSAESEALMRNGRRVMAAGAAEAVEELFGEADDGQSRVWLSTKTPLRGSDGRVVGVVGVSLEITERKRFENRLQQMVHELNHRVKNTLATIQAIAGQSLRQADPLLRQKLEDRLLALAAAHDVLTREGWTGAGITEIVEAALAPVGGLDSGRIRMAGPKLRLLPRAALALSMGLHELARNAVTHGALSREAGRVTVDWIIEGARLRLTWTEQGGPPVLSPKARGFGSRLVERSVARALDGTAAIRFNPDGVSCVIEAPLDGIAASAQVLHLPNVGSRNER